MVVDVAISLRLRHIYGDGLTTTGLDIILARV